MFESFSLKVEFLVAIASKKQKQIDDQLAARVDPSSTFCLYVVKFGPNVFSALEPLVIYCNLMSKLEVDHEWKCYSSPLFKP